MATANNALVLTFVSLRFTPAAQLGRWASKQY
jgi:hypothetical protein